MQIVLCAFDAALYAAWEDVPPSFRATIEGAGHSLALRRGDITSLTVTAVVSPANSHGYMRGGVDLAYTRRFGPGLEETVRREIGALPGGVLPIGEAIVAETGDTLIPYCISAPTMERPMLLADSRPVFAAARAATAAALAHGFDSVAFPGMGTGTGGLDPGDAAAAMLAGITAAF